MTKDTQDQVPDQVPGQQATGELVPAGAGLPAVATTDVVRMIREQMDNLPTVEGDPTESMMAAILMAENPADMEAIFESLHFKESVNERVTVHTFRALDADQPGRFEKYLLLDVTVLSTGERRAMSCSSEMAMVQLMWHWAKGLLPYDFEIVAKKKPTKAQRTPLHLRPLGRPRGWTDDQGNGQ